MTEWTNSSDFTYETSHPKSQAEKLNKTSIWVLFNEHETCRNSPFPDSFKVIEGRISVSPTPLILGFRKRWASVTLMGRIHVYRSQPSRQPTWVKELSSKWTLLVRQQKAKGPRKSLLSYIFGGTLALTKNEVMHQMKRETRAMMLILHSLS